MRRTLRLLFAVSVAAMLMLPSALAAQEGPPPGGGPRGGRGMMDPQARADMMAKDLNLSDDQKAKVLDILKDSQKQMGELRENQSLSQDDRRAKMMDIRKSTDTKIRGVLNADQQKKFDEMNEKMRERRPGGPGGPGGEKPPQP